MIVAWLTNPGRAPVLALKSSYSELPITTMLAEIFYGVIISLDDVASSDMNQLSYFILPSLILLPHRNKTEMNSYPNNIALYVL